MMSWWGEGGFKRLHYRVTHPALGDDIILPARGSAHTDSSREVEVTVTPGGQAIKPGEMIILSAVGRPHPGGYYLWTSSDPSVASVEPFLNDGGAEHPNRARVVGHRLGEPKNFPPLHHTPPRLPPLPFPPVFCPPPTPLAQPYPPIAASF